MSRTSILKGITGAIMLLGVMGLASQASAYTFDVCQAGGFNSAPDANDDFFGGIPDTNGACVPAIGTNKGLEWFPGSPAKSSVVIDFNAFSLNLDLTKRTHMAMGIIATITQINNTIYKKDSIGGLQGFPYTHTISGESNLLILGDDDAPVFGVPATLFSLTHTETSNSGTCPSNKTNTNSTTPCEDIWEFDLDPPPGTSVDFMTLDAPDFVFTASFDLVVEAPNVVEGNTVYTPETQTSYVDVKLTISSRRIPEPGTLALLGIGLTGLGFAGRRKRG